MDSTHCPATTAPPGNSLSLADLERIPARSQTFAWALIAGLPVLGATLTIMAGLPTFAALMAGCFLLATAFVSARAIATFVGKTLRLLVAARLVVVIVLASLLVHATGSAWNGIVSATLLWLVADRVLGRRALYDLWKLARKDSPKP